MIGGGLPVGAYGGRADIMSKVAPAGPVYQAGTLSGNPLAVAAGLAMLRHLKAHPGGVRHGWKRAARRLAASAPAGVTVNRVGSMFTFFFTRAGDGLGIGEEVRHGAVRTVLPGDAGARGVSGALAVRGGVRERGAHGRGYREDDRGGWRKRWRERIDRRKRLSHQVSQQRCNFVEHNLPGGVLRIDDCEVVGAGDLDKSGGRGIVAT